MDLILEYEKAWTVGDQREAYDNNPTLVGSQLSDSQEPEFHKLPRLEIAAVSQGS